MERCVETLENTKIGFATILMTLSAFGPIFLIWSIRGLPPNTFPCFVTTLFFVVAFTLTVASMIIPITFKALSKKTSPIIWNYDEFVKADEHIIAYLLTLIFPLMMPTIANEKDLYSVIAITAIAMTIYYRMSMYYANAWALMLGYSVSRVKIRLTGSPSGTIIFISPKNFEIPSPPARLRVVPIGGPVYLVKPRTIHDN